MLSDFHPITARWFSENVGVPTGAQRRGWTAIREKRDTLIAAPTGSGKTLAAFLIALDDLVHEGLDTPLPDEVRVVYVSPLKALSTDIHKNLAEPRRGIRRIAEELGLGAPHITAAVRTGDTPQADRVAMLRTPPHILVTTPESLYLLLTAEGSRRMLETVRAVIVDEIHAVIGGRRGAHLAVSLERLQQVARAPLQRIGLSATQKPIEEVARFLAGVGRPQPAIVDEGHRREMDLGIELPGAALEAVMVHEVWEEYYERLTALITAHRTTLVFVNTRRMAERVARHLSDRLGKDSVTAHHGSLSKETRLDAEMRLKSGALKALVATASLELGIDIGHVDLVCQIGSPHRIATVLQRIGRSGHTIHGTPNGRIFPISRDDLVECAALLRSIRAGDLDRIVSHDAPLDVLTQQIVAEASSSDYQEDDLFALVRRAWPYRNLSRADFDAVVTMAAEGFATRRGRRGALLHRDEVNRRLRGRRGSRLLAITSGGAIPDMADYRVVLDPDDTFIGTLNEDFAIESMAGDVFQLGNASWRVVRVGAGVVRVADAKGAPPNIPFWLGEAPARSDELSRAVSDLRGEIDRLLEADGDVGPSFPPSLAQMQASSGGRAEALATAGSSGARPEGRAYGWSSAIEWLAAETGASSDAAEQVVTYFADAKRALGVLPTQQTLVLERFFDESGGMQLVLHAPFGSRVNKAWGLALRKRFCRQFNFELQAAATENGLLLSLGPQHSFPLADVFRYLHPNTARDVLIQAFLDAPVFQTRWRWNTTISLAVPRNRAGKKVPPQLQRMLADDLMAAVFPDAAACLENIPGDREIPDHPLVGQTVRDCLDEAMDFDGLTEVLSRIHRGELRLIARDTPEPSPLSHEILTARPYAFLDDAPLEERRAHAVYARRATEPAGSGDLGVLDTAAIARVREEQRPAPRDADELHDALLVAGCLTVAELADVSPALLVQLAETGRAGQIEGQTPNQNGGQTPDRNRGQTLWIAAERWPELTAIHPDAIGEPALTPPEARASKPWTREQAIIEFVRSRLTIDGPTTASALGALLGVSADETEAALLALESEGVVLRGAFETQTLEWCDRALLARIHRYTLNRLRAEIEPVDPADFTRFLFDWQHADPNGRLTGIDGLRVILGQLDGFEAPAAAWERAILPARLTAYDPSLLDLLCLTGEIGWARLSSAPTAVASATPIALFLREHGPVWQTLRSASAAAAAAGTGVTVALDDRAAHLAVILRTHGASFFRDLKAACGLDDEHLQQAIASLVAAGAATSDGFDGLRTIVDARAKARAYGPNERRPDLQVGRLGGRWSLVAAGGADAADGELAIETQARALLRRYGVVFRRLLARETNVTPWRVLTRVYRRLEARGEIRGGRFVGGIAGEQFALPEAVDRLREVRRIDRDGRLVTISAADPLNLAGFVDAGDRVRAVPAHRIVYRDGVPLAALEGEYMRPLRDIEPAIAADVASALAGRRLPAITSGFVGTAKYGT
jgi:ATP-dependent Lhr-like helicase